MPFLRAQSGYFQLMLIAEKQGRLDSFLQGHHGSGPDVIYKSLKEFFDLAVNPTPSTSQRVLLQRCFDKVWVLVEIAEGLYMRHGLEGRSDLYRTEVMESLGELFLQVFIKANKIYKEHLGSKATPWDINSTGPTANVTNFEAFLDAQFEKILYTMSPDEIVPGSSHQSRSLQVKGERQSPRFGTMNKRENSGSHICSSARGKPVKKRGSRRATELENIGAHDDEESKE